MVVQFLVKSRDVYLNVGMIFVQSLYALGSGEQVNGLDIRDASVFKKSYRRGSRAARRKHRIDDHDFAFGDVGRHLAIILNGFERLRISVKTDVTDLRGRKQIDHSVNHAQTRAENGNDREFFACDHGRHRLLDRGLDLNHFERKVARYLVAHEHRDLGGEFAELL